MRVVVRDWSDRWNEQGDDVYIETYGQFVRHVIRGAPMYVRVHVFDVEDTGRTDTVLQRVDTVYVYRDLYATWLLEYKQKTGDNDDPKGGL